MTKINIKLGSIDTKINLKIVLALLSVILFTLVFSYANYTRLQYANATLIDMVRYDSNVSSIISASPSVNLTYGALSYLDRSPHMPDVFAEVCHENLIVNSTVDFVYSTYSNNITRSVLNLPIQVTRKYNKVVGPILLNCSLLDVQFSAARAVYPGYLQTVITTGSDTYFTENTTMTSWGGAPFNGTIISNLTVDYPPKGYWFFVPLILDDQNQTITTNRSYLLASLVSAQNVSLAEQVLYPNQILNYSGVLTGGEKYIVNGITLLEVQVFSPCGDITRPGYYVLNESLYNLNDSCINVTGVNDVKLNFAGELLDGDEATTNGSMRNDTCAVIVRNARNVTLENFATQQFYDGVCVDNSTVTIYGTDLIDNINGMRVYNGSLVTVVKTTFDNRDFELNITDNSQVTIVNGSFTTALTSGIYFDTWIRSVPTRPTLPTISGFTHIEQFLQVGRSDSNGWAKVGFNYELPLPNSVLTSQIYIYKYNGTYEGTSVTDNNTNITTTTYDWTAGNWTSQTTVLSSSQKLIYIANVTSFSVFAPFGIINTSGGGGGGGGSGGGGGGSGSPGGSSGGSGGGAGIPTGSSTTDKPKFNFSDNRELRLTVADEISMMQGAVGDVYFKLENVGTVAVNDISILAEVPRGWKSSVTVIDVIYPTETLQNKFSLSVFENMMPADYYVPITVMIGEEVVISRILKVTVTPRGNLTRLLVTNYDPVINLLPNSQKDVTFTAKNIGDFSLNNVQILLEPNNCIRQVIGSHELGYKEEKKITYRFVSGDAANCKYTLKFVENDKLVDFIPVTFQVRQLTLIDQTIKLILIGLIVSAWFAIGIVIVVKRRKPPYNFPPSTGNYGPGHFSPGGGERDQVYGS